MVQEKGGLTNSVTPVGDNSWSWDSTVDGEDYAVNTVWCSSSVGDVEPVFSNYTCIWDFIVVIGGEIIV